MSHNKEMVTLELKGRIHCSLCIPNLLRSMITSFTFTQTSGKISKLGYKLSKKKTFDMLNVLIWQECDTVPDDLLDCFQDNYFD